MTRTGPGVNDGGRDRQARWQRDVGPFTPSRDDTRAAYADLVGRYGEPSRHYHTMTHVDAVLEAIDDLLAAEPPLPRHEVQALRFAGWFHDVINDATAHDNERASGRLARARLGALGVDAAVIAEAVRLIELTAGHEVAPDDRPGALLADADLSILGAPAEAYDVYAQAIREEHAHVDDDAYRAGRQAVLASFAARPVIFLTPTGAARWERQARANLTREQRSLERSDQRSGGSGSGMAPGPV